MESDTVKIKRYEQIRKIEIIRPERYFIKNYDLIPISNQYNNKNSVGHAISYLINYYIYLLNGYKIEINKKTNLFELIKDQINVLIPTKLFFTKNNLLSANSIYYFARKNDDIILQNNNESTNIETHGTKIYNGLESIKSNIVLDKDWSNQIEKPLNYDLMIKFNINLSYGYNYFSVLKNLKIMKNYLLENRPIILGININNKFFNLKFGEILKCPKNATEIIGTQSIVLIGYVNELNAFVARNSFGTEYCANGYFMISYNYMISPFTYDLFVLR